MVIPVLLLGARANTADPEQPVASKSHPASPPAASSAAASPLAYEEFVAALKSALRDFHRPDLLAQNPLLRFAADRLGVPAGPAELRAMLSEAVTALFANPRDEKLRRVIELTYFQPGPKQEAVAERLSLAFGTYRRYLATARDRLGRWLWQGASLAPPKLRPPSAAVETASAEGPSGETAAPPASGAPARPRLSVVVLPFLNLGGSVEQDHE